MSSSSTFDTKGDKNKKDKTVNKKKNMNKEMRLTSASSKSFSSTHSSDKGGDSSKNFISGKMGNGELGVVEYKSRNVIYRIWKIIMKVLNLNEDTFEKNFNVAFIHFVVVLATGVHITVSGFLLAMYYVYDFDYYYIPGIVSSVCVPSAFILCLVGWVMSFCGTTRGWLVHGAVLVSNTIYACALCFSFGTVLDTGHLHLLWLLGVIFIISVNGGYEVLWTLAYVVLFTVYYVIQVVKLSTKGYTFQVSINQQISIMCTNIFVDFSIMFFVLLFQFYSQYKLRSLRTTIENVANAISKLNFESESVLNILNSPDDMSESVIVLFKQLLGNIMEYKQFLPQGLLKGTDSDDEDDKSQHSDGSNTSSERKRLSEKRGRKSGGRRKSDGYTSSHGSGRGKSGAYIDKLLDEKYGTFMFIKIKDWFDVVKTVPFEEIGEVYTNVVGAVVRVIREHRGIILSMKNDEISCCWNIKKRVVNHEQSACTSAIAICEACKNLPTKLSITVLTDFTICGNMGCKEIKNFNYFGEKVNGLPDVLNEICDSYVNKDSTCVLVDQKVLSRIKFHFKCLYVNTVRYGNEKTKVYQLITQNEIKKGEEWNYQISSDLKQDEGEGIFVVNDKIEKYLSLEEYGKVEKQLSKFLLMVQKSEELKKFYDLYSLLKTNIEKESDSLLKAKI